MPHRNKNRLVTAHACVSVGSSLVGMFLPFFLMDAFGVGIVKALGLSALMMFLSSALVVPIVYWGTRFFHTRTMIQIGWGSGALFYLSLNFPQPSWWYVAMVFLLFSCFEHFLWPCYNYTITHSTKDGTRGNFLGNLQAVSIGSNLLGPLITGFLFHWGMQSYALWVSALCFAIAVFLVRAIRIEDVQMKKLSVFWSFIKRVYRQKPTLRKAFFLIGVPFGVLLFGWPFFLELALGSFSLMGITASIVAVGEMISAKFFGKFADKYSFKKLFQWGVWSRFVDLGIRIIFLKFRSFGVVLAVQFANGILGPIYHTGMWGRLIENIEEEEDFMLEYFVFWNFCLSFTRGVTIALMALSIHFWGVTSIAFFLLLGGMVAFTYRKF